MEKTRKMTGRDRNVSAKKSRKIFFRVVTRWTVGGLIPLLMSSLIIGLSPARAKADSLSCSLVVPLACGETKPGQLATAREADCLLFSARPGEVVSITAATAPGTSGAFHPLWLLFAPDGTQVPLSDDSLEGCEGQCESQPLPAKGTYTLKVFDDAHNASGSYNISLEAVSATFNGASNGPPNPACSRGLDDGTQPISCGETLTGQVDVTGETDTFTFSARPGEVVSITAAATPGASSTFHPLWLLFAPDGTQVPLSDDSLEGCEGQCESQPLPAKGTYTIKIFDDGYDATGAYSVSLENLSVCSEGDDLSGTKTNTPNSTASSTSSKATASASLPDLVVTAVSNPPGAAGSGGQFSVTDTTLNQGSAVVGASTTRYYLSIDTVVGNTGDKSIGSRSVPALAPGTSSTGTVTGTIPSMTPGTYYLFACADWNLNRPESNEQNNCKAAATKVEVKLPDLVVTAVSNPPAVVKKGSQFLVTDTTLNQGPAPAEAVGASTTRYYLSIDTVVGNTGDKSIGSRSVPALAPEASSTGTVTVILSVPPSPGTYYLFACADWNLNRPESNEQNNCKAAATRVVVSP